MQTMHVKGRKGISPVIATVILIAITLIAAIAIAGFVFGLFGSFTSNAQVTATASCSVTNTACTVTLSNTGTANTNVLSGSITYAGQTVTALTVASATCTLSGTAYAVTAGTTCNIVYTTPATPAPATGAQFVITLSLANGGQPSATGVFQ